MVITLWYFFLGTLAIEIMEVKIYILGSEPLGKTNLLKLFGEAERLRSYYYSRIGGKYYLLHFLMHFLKGKTIALLFLEPSSRTSSSFDLAARTLGAETLLLDHNLSTEKGETLQDTTHTLADYP